MAKKKTTPVWNVYLEQYGNKIEVANVFTFGQFATIEADLKNILKRYRKAVKTCESDGDRKKIAGRTENDLRDCLKASLCRYFWAKCEYEVLISEWPPHPDYEAGLTSIEHMVKTYGDKWYTNKEHLFEVADHMTSRETIKVDVYGQIMMNYDAFERIVFEHIGFAKEA